MNSSRNNSVFSDEMTSMVIVVFLAILCLAAVVTCISYIHILGKRRSISPTTMFVIIVTAANTFTTLCGTPMTMMTGIWDLPTIPCNAGSVLVLSRLIGALFQCHVLIYEIFRLRFGPGTADSLYCWHNMIVIIPATFGVTGLLTSVPYLHGGNVSAMFVLYSGNCDSQDTKFVTSLFVLLTFGAPLCLSSIVLCCIVTKITSSVVRPVEINMTRPTIASSISSIRSKRSQRSMTAPNLLQKGPTIRTSVSPTLSAAIEEDLKTENDDVFTTETAMRRFGASSPSDRAISGNSFETLGERKGTDERRGSQMTCRSKRSFEVLGKHVSSVGHISLRGGLAVTLSLIGLQLMMTPYAALVIKSLVTKQQDDGSLGMVSVSLVYAATSLASILYGAFDGKPVTRLRLLRQSPTNSGRRVLRKMTA